MLTVAMLAAALAILVMPMHNVGNVGSGIDPVNEGSGIDPVLISDASDVASVNSSGSEPNERCDVAEIFSPPRICPRAQYFGLIGGFSHNVTTGVDLSTCDGRAQSWNDLQAACPTLLVASPPCTWFSCMQNINRHRYTDDVRSSRGSAALSLLSYAARCCAEQHRNGRFFVFEHPHTATSWHMTPLLDLHALAGVAEVDFDQCATGLVAPGTGLPIKKRTRLLTNLPEILFRFAHLQCTCVQPHQICEGSSMGIRLSTFLPGVHARAL